MRVAAWQAPSANASIVTIGAILLTCSPETSFSQELEANSSASEDLRRRIAVVGMRYGLPGIGGAYVTADGTIVAAVAGRARADSDRELGQEALFHLGSVTKPVTATMVARLVDRGAVTWELTVEEALGALIPCIHPDHRDTTLATLLRHRGGFQPFEEDEEFKEVPALEGAPRAKRLAFTRFLLCRAPWVEPGSEHHYSNAGYTVAAAMVEEVTGSSWEELVVAEVLEPLEIDSHAFGWPADADSASTWGHTFEKSGWTVHDPAKDGYRLTDQAIGPAGDLSLTMSGLARFARLHQLGLAGKDGVLPAVRIREIHTPLEGDEYALGWNVRSTRHSHLGSAGTFFAAVMILPERNLSIMVATNGWSDAETEFGRDLLSAVLAAARAAGHTR